MAFGVDGNAEMDGAILVVSALDSSLPGSAGRRLTRLIAKGTPAQTSCADADGDGRAGPIRLAASLEDARTGALSPVAIETAPDQDIDSNGAYALLVQIGDDRVTREARVRFGLGRRKRRRRRDR